MKTTFKKLIYEYMSKSWTKHKYNLQLWLLTNNYYKLWTTIYDLQFEVKDLQKLRVTIYI